MKLFFNILIILFLPLTIFAIVTSNNKSTSAYRVQAERLQPIKESETTDPYIKHIRKAIDGYLKGTNDGISLPVFVINTSTDSEGKLFGLASFDKMYFTSDFTVIKIETGKPYGKIISIFFEKKPDKIFDCWILKESNGNYDLRGFWENSPSSSE